MAPKSPWEEVLGRPSLKPHDPPRTTTGDLRIIKKPVIDRSLGPRCTMKMLSVESGEDESIYRIQRDDGRIVYVTVTDPNFLLGNERNHGSSVLAKLADFKEWAEPWTTLHIDKEGEVQKDISPPHTVPKKYLLGSYPIYDIASLSTLRQCKSRTSEVTHHGKAFFLKIARFPHELQWVIQEIQAYHALAESSLAPKLIGYVFETSEDRVVGFLVEKAEGPFPASRDLEECGEALCKLHDYLIHGDLVKYNIIMTSEGPKFIDLENAVLVGTEGWSTSLRDEESQNLEAKLTDESGAGRPWQLD